MIIYLLFCSLLEETCHIHFKMLWKNNISQLYLFGYIYSKQIGYNSAFL